MTEAEGALSPAENDLVTLFSDKKIPYIIARNKSDLHHTMLPPAGNTVYVSAITGDGIFELKEKIGSLAAKEESGKRIVADLITENDLVVLVVPIDKAAPKGRLTLPQQQTIRDILDAGAVSVVVRDTELTNALGALDQKPKMVITDSQVFARVSKEVPEDILLTSFSILFARYKGDLIAAVRGAAALNKLSDGDRVLICEGCTHHRQCGDIGTQKLPAWITGYTGRKLSFEFTSGGEFPEDLSGYALVVHCGGCMLNDREMKYRVKQSLDSGTPITNYGTAIAHIHGILERSLRPFPEAIQALKE